MGRTSYRRVAGLAVVVLLGWAWDFALGGGGTHAVAWLGVLVLVVGVGALAVRGARLAAADGSDAADVSDPADVADGSDGSDVPDAAPHPTHDPAGDPASLGSVIAPVGADRQIRLAEPADLPALPELERSADTLFSVAGYGEVGPPCSVAELAAAELVLVAGRPVLGYARVEVVDGAAHLQGLSVALRSMKRGIGSALIEAVCDWATAAGFESVTLTTFADVPWNAPYLARRGFHEATDPGPQLRAIRRSEDGSALAGVGRRIAMRRTLT